MLPKKLFIVLHVSPMAGHGFDAEVNQAYENALTAVTNGADGVFLIDMNRGRHWCDMLTFYNAFMAKFEGQPEPFVGINLLDVRNGDDLAHHARQFKGLNAVWTDWTPGHEIKFPEGVIYYGGAAFKGQSQNLTDAQLVDEVLQTARFADVITTSVPRTGVAPDVEKLMQIAAIPPFHIRKEFPLGVASGVDVTNVAGMLPYVDHFLVASSVTTGDNLVMGGSVAALSREIHGYKG